jgi:hypothetical protein
VLTQVPDPNQAGYTIRTVTYTNYVNVDGEIEDRSFCNLD